jgi:prevent-host-death family protein
MNMGNVTAKQLKQKTGEIIRRVKSGERLTVTYRGRPVAVIVPPPAEGDDRSGDLRPFEQAWQEIEASLEKTEPQFKDWREAMKWARKEVSS